MSRINRKTGFDAVIFGNTLQLTIVAAVCIVARIKCYLNAQEEQEPCGKKFHCQSSLYYF